MSTKSSGSNGDMELKRVFQNADDPVLTAPEVAEQLNITQQSAHSRLTKANERGEIRRKKVGARAVVWWPVGQEFSDFNR